VPSGGTGDVFMGGVALPVPNGLPGSIKSVTWSAEFWSDTAGLTVNWKWAAAAYSPGFRRRLQLPGRQAGGQQHLEHLPQRRPVRHPGGVQVVGRQGGLGGRRHELHRQLHLVGRREADGR